MEFDYQSIIIVYFSSHTIKKLNIIVTNVIRMT
jgi:hypothetical protein